MGRSIKWGIAATSACIAVGAAGWLAEQAMASNPTASSGNPPAAASGGDALSDQVIQSVRVATGDVISSFDPKAPSLVMTSAGALEDHRSGTTVTLDTAEKAVADQVGVGPSAVVASQLASLTTTTTGLRADGAASDATQPLYSGTAVWAIEYKDLQIRRSGPVGGPSHDSTYTANMVFYVDAYTGQFLLGDQA